MLWELAQLDPGTGIADEAGWTAWFEARYATLGVGELAAECLAELRVLGAVEASGPVALTPLGRAVLDDPTSVEALLATDIEHATVQADLTVIAPPGLHHDRAQRLEALALIESSAGVTVYRLDATRIAKAVQAGDPPEEIIGFLTSLAGGALPDVVTRLVRDSAEQAGRVRLVSATTVLVVTDPADLVTACSIKSAKLTAVSDTVAVSELAYDKVRAALDRKGLAPEVTIASTTTATPRSSVDSVAAYRQQLDTYRSLATRRRNEIIDHHIEHLEATIEALADPGARLAVPTALALTPTAAQQLESGEARAR